MSKSTTAPHTYKKTIVERIREIEVGLQLQILWRAVKTNEWNFIQFWSHVYLGSSMCWLDFGVKTSKVKVTPGGGMTVNGSPSSSI